MKKPLILILVLAISFSASAQKKSAELFSVGNRSVSSSEFLHMYTKNQMNKKVDYSTSALNEYLDLYSLFKMKVSQAYEMNLDTIPSVRREIDNYRKQLAKSYLTNRKAKEMLVKEAYERSKKDVKVAHILLSLKPNSKDTIRARKTIDSLYKQITKGKITFEKAAQMFSDDKQSAINGGSIGYITALQVVYPFENLAYNTKKGQITKPFRTVYGYHLLKKLNERPARGKIQVAQIMTEVSKSSGEEGRIKAKKKIDEAYGKLKAGKSWEEVEKQYNEDRYTKNSGGVMPVFGVGKMVPNYENAAFALNNRGDFSKVVKTANGYHIISLMKKIEMKSFEESKAPIERLIQRDGRIKVAQDAFVGQLKKKMNYKQNDVALNKLIQAIPDSNLRNGKFDPLNYRKMTETIFTMDGTKFTQADFANYIKVYTRGRIYGQKETALTSLLDNYTKKVLTDYEESQLEKTNPEYKNILQEYREGILIFELTKQKVWDKAPRDTAGLKAFYQANKNDYMWDPAVEGQLYTAKKKEDIMKLVKELNKPNKQTISEITKNVNGDGPQDKLSVEEGKFEQKRFKFKRPLTAGKYMPYFKNKDGSYSLLMVDKVFNDKTQKTLKEAKGYVVSDYQDELEKAWKQELRAKYPLNINKKVLSSLSQ
jgi:peptidyl-prolyl cis-trans isomerase SurA